jgi:transposase
VKAELVFAFFPSDGRSRRSAAEHELSETLLRRWRDEIIEVVRGAPSGGRDRSPDAEQRRRTAQLERALGRKTIEVEIAGELLRRWEYATRRLSARVG